MQSSLNILLVVGSIFSITAALLHFACIFWGAPMFRFLGAGEPVVQMAAEGHWYPNFIAFAVGALLSVWSLYALSGAGVIAQLPYARAALSVITFIYLLRAVAFPLLKPAFPGNSDTFWLASSAICLIIGLVHFFGLMQVWEHI